MPTRLNSRSLINVLPNLQPPSEVFRLGDIFNEATRGHYQSGATVFPILSIPSDSSGRGRGPALPRPGTENPEVPHSKRFLRHLSVPSFLRPVCFSAAAPYPVSKGSAAIRRSMLPNSRRVRCPPASSSQDAPHIPLGGFTGRFRAFVDLDRK